MSRAPVLIPDKPGRRYVWPPPPEPPEKIVPSVTTILDNHAKQDWLVPAAGRRVADYAVDHVLRWEQMPERDAKTLLAGVARREWDRKANKGTVVHNAVDAYLDGMPTVDLDENLLPYITGALAFLQDHARRVVHHEAVVYNLKYDYAGRVDAICDMVGGSLAIVDWKTGKVGSDMALQLNAYAHAEFVGFEDGGQATLPPINAGWVVQLPGDGTYTAYPVEIDKRHFKTFVAYRTVQKWKDEDEDMALGEPVTPEISSEPEEEPATTTN